MRTLAILSLSLVTACTIKPSGTAPVTRDHTGTATNTGGAYGGGAVSVVDITDDQGKVYHIQQGAKGDPSVIGCADGQREAFVDATAFPKIAGCLASWDGGKSMRAPQTGKACGDDLGPCAVPQDACAAGWHTCGASGSVAELRQVSGQQCEQAGGGRFSAAISHCKTQDGCNYDMSASASYECYPEGWCSESVCCGADCGEFGSCTGGVWDNDTHIAQGTDQGCGNIQSNRAGGVLCCK
jgi:hypothetical protein